MIFRLLNNTRTMRTIHLRCCIIGILFGGIIAGLVLIAHRPECSTNSTCVECEKIYRVIQKACSVCKKTIPSNKDSYCYNVCNVGLYDECLTRLQNFDLDWYCAYDTKFGCSIKPSTEWNMLALFLIVGPIALFIICCLFHTCKKYKPCNRSR